MIPHLIRFLQHFRYMNSTNVSIPTPCCTLFLKKLLLRDPGHTMWASMLLSTTEWAVSIRIIIESQTPSSSALLIQKSQGHLKLNQVWEPLGWHTWAVLYIERYTSKATHLQLWRWAILNIWCVIWSSIITHSSVTHWTFESGF